MVTDDDYTDPSEIARIFANELLELQAEEGDGEEDEEDDVQRLGREFRQSLEQGALTDADVEWADLVESSRRASDRLQVQLQDAAVISGGGSGSSQAQSSAWSALQDLRLEEATVNMNLNNLASISTPRAAPPLEQAEIEETVRELMDSMLASVEYTWKIVLSKVREGESAVVIDTSMLPQIIADDDEGDVDAMAHHQALYRFDEHSYEGTRLQRSEHLERDRMQDAFNLLREQEAEAVLLREAEETARILEEDKEQRLQRKQRMMDEIVRVRRIRAATRIQSLHRGALGRRRFSHHKAAAKLSAEQAAERRRIEAELVLEKRRIEAEKERIMIEMERRQRELAVEKREEGLMRDADLESMQARHWAAICAERALQQAFAEREAERLFAEEKFKNGRLKEVAVAPLQKKEPTPEKVPPLTDSASVDSHKVPAAAASSAHESDVVHFCDEDSEEEEEEVVAKAATKAAKPKLKPKLKATKKAKKAKNDSDDDEEDEEEEEEEEEEEDDEEEREEEEEEEREEEEEMDKDEMQEAESENAAKEDLASTTVSAFTRIRNDTPASEDTVEHWRSLAAIAALRGSEEVHFDAAGVERAISALQSKSNVLRIDLVEESLVPAISTAPLAEAHSPVMISPRAKVGGMKLVASRPPQAVGDSGASDDQRVLARREKKMENSLLEERRAAREKIRRALYKYILTDEAHGRHSKKRAAAAPTQSPVLLAIRSWQRFCEEELGITRANVDQALDPAQPERNQTFEDDEWEETKGETRQNTAADAAKIQQLGLKRDPRQVKSLQLNVEGLHSSSFLSNYTSIRHLELNVNRLCSLDGLGRMTSLETLSVKDNALTDISAMRRLRDLRSLSLDTNRLTDLSDLQHLSQLSSLSANANALAFMPSLLGCSRLQRLELYQNLISDVSIDSLKQLSSLTYLDLGRNRLEHIDGVALSHCVLLQTLVLSQNRLTEVPTPLYLPNLKILWLGGNKLATLDPWLPDSQEDFSSNSVAANWPALGPLDDAVMQGGASREGRPATREGAARGDDRDMLTWPIFMPMLEKLHLQDNAIRRVDATVMKCFPSLALVDLSFNAIENASSLGVTACPKLHTLHIQENPISTSTAGTDALHKWLLSSCPALRVISGDALADSEALQELGRAAARQAARDALLASCTANATTRGASLTTRADCSETSRLVHLVGMLVAEQNVLEANQKLDKKTSQAAGAKAGVPKPPGTEETSAAAPVAWDVESLDVLKRHVKQLVLWPHTGADAHSRAGFVSYRLHNCQPRKAAPSSRRGFQGKNSFQVRKIAASLIQALARGRRTRLGIKRALTSVQYQDDEIDEIDAMIKAMDLGVSDLDLAFVGSQPRKSGSAGPSAAASGSKLTGTSETMVYGDHRRTRKSNSAGWNEQKAFQSMGSAEDDEEIPSHLSTWMSDNVAQLRQALTADYGGNKTHSEPHVAPPPDPYSPRPSSAVSESSTITANSVPSYAHARGAGLGAAGADAMADDIESDAGSRGRGSRQLRTGGSHPQMQLAQEWGISDPKVMAMMMKRNNRLQGLPANQGLPTGSAGGTKKKPMAVVSGSFGGKKTTMRGKKGGSKAPPAWVLGYQQDEDL